MTPPSRAGETLYLPSLWFHQVEQRAGETGLAGLTVAVNYWFALRAARPGPPNTPCPRRQVRHAL